MTSLTREQEQELRRVISLARQEPGLTALRKLAEHRLEKCRDRLMNCPPAELGALQAEARTWGWLCRLKDNPADMQA